jgi:hypothetical protein
VATATRQRAAPRARSAGPLAPVAIRRRSGGSISILARMRAPGAVQPIITLKQGGRAGVRAQQTGVAGVVSGRGSRRWAYGAGGQRSGAIGRRWGAARRDVARSDGGPAWSLWRKRGVAWQCMRTLGATAAARDGQSVRRQCCCDGSAEGGAVRCAVARSAACDA